MSQGLNFYIHKGEEVCAKNVYTHTYTDIRIYDIYIYIYEPDTFHKLHYHILSSQF